MTRLAALSLLFSAAAAFAAEPATEWRNFLGPTHDAHATGDPPIEWSETKNVAWKTPIHGRGWSSPVVSEGRIWLTTATQDGKEMSVLCVDAASGEILHDKLLFTNDKTRPIHSLNSYASPTAVAEPGRVYINFGSYGTACLDAKTAEVLWERRDLPCNHWRGPGSSPILFENLLILHFDGYDYQYVAALDKTTGKTVWRKDRQVDYGTDNGDIMKAFCTPTIMTIDDRLQLISPTSKASISYDPRTGEELWRVRFNGFSATARPLFADGMFFINTGFSKAEMYAVRAGGKGDVTDTHVEWISKNNVPSKPSSLLIDGLLYMIHDSGVMTCLDAESGEEIWQERIGGKFSASPLYAGGHIYLFSQEGETTVVKPGEEYEIVARNKLDKGFMASPAATGDALILRTETHLYRIEQK